MSDTRNYANCMGNEGGTPVYLEDKKLSESASQSTLASTDAIMLKGTDGTYHEIARDSLVEAVRSVMGGILKNLDKGTTIGALAALGSGDDLGSITPANLASVLGVNRNIVVDPSDSVTDFNELADNLNYRINSKNYANAPKVGLIYGTLIVYYNWFGNAAIQQIFISASAPVISYRVRFGGTWSQWQQLAVVTTT